MKNVLFFLIFLLIINCSSNKKVHWCGDHACINKKERQAYFKKTMIVEIREINKDNKKSYSEIEKITLEARADEKKRVKNEKDSSKQARLEEKQKIKDEKRLAKQARLEEKQKIKDEKRLAKQARLEEKPKIKNIKKLTNKTKLVKKITKTTEITKDEFNEIVEKIAMKNMFRPYPNINDIPN